MTDGKIFGEARAAAARVFVGKRAALQLGVAASTSSRQRGGRDTVKGLPILRCATDTVNCWHDSRMGLAMLRA